MRRSRRATVTVQVGLDEFDDGLLIEECRQRNIGVSERDIKEFDDTLIIKELRRRNLDNKDEIDYSTLRTRLMRNDIVEALYLIEKALPSEFGGFSDQVIRSLTQRAA